MKRLSLAALIALAATAAPLTSMAGPRVDLFVGVAPPAPLVERMPPQRLGYVWAPGHWEWNGRRHVWLAGYWVAARPGYAYSAPVWMRREGGRYLQPERWTPARGYERRYDGPRHDRDRDHDGVPDRYDHRPDDPYRR